MPLNFSGSAVKRRGIILDLRNISYIVCVCIFLANLPTTTLEGP